MTVTLIGDKSGVYIDPKNNNAHVDYKSATNIDKVNLFGVNHLVIKKDPASKELKVVQAGGYNRIRGLFVDLY